MGSVVVALLVANSSLAATYDEFLQSKMGFHGAGLHLNYSLLSWINAGLMAIFFLMVGLEIKRELIEGELSSFKKAALPILAALGGVAVPAVVDHDRGQRGAQSTPLGRAKGCSCATHPGGPWPGRHGILPRGGSPHARTPGRVARRAWATVGG